MIFRTEMNNYIPLLTVIIMTLLSTSSMNAQDLGKHQWKQRLLLVITDNGTNGAFKQQLQELKRQEKGLEDRKLIVYQITPTAYRTGTADENKWIESTTLYRQHKTIRKPFEVILIGLDGEKKMEQYDVLSTTDLFNTIDAMPMRRAETRRKNNP
ncbi:DUF4174 domain-containing protein [Psychroserpens sp.]|uniref:DUF4174 domain-containing protein n=1 Tax=Psychroserpens sp. TaxID=2020870 RepID=UPI003C723842